MMVSMLLVRMLTLDHVFTGHAHPLSRDARTADSKGLHERHHGCGKIKPKVMITNMFSPEAVIWQKRLPDSGYGDLLRRNISIPGLSPLYPAVHCTRAGDICQITAGEAEINAAASISALVFSGKFDLTQTYFLVAGIAGVNPKLGSLGSVALAKFAVQVALQYELDARDMPDNFTTGYLPYGTYSSDQYPTSIYGTEVMELNEALRDAAYEYAVRAALADSPLLVEYRAKYGIAGDTYAAATYDPSILKCDTATSDVYYSGTLLSEAFENTTKLWTNQSDMTYCMTAQEDSAVLQVLMRADVAGLVDFSRTIVMRAGSNFDRPAPYVSSYDHLRVLNENGSPVAIENMYQAGIEIIEGIIEEWDSKFERGIEPTSYIGDIFGSLGGEPDFGPGSVFGGVGASTDGSHSLGL
ncbi:purine nucleoside permease-domain-containing protein [Xylariales sp. AK1849]|nr:purine nucleoside permease-domain-containing protein [Xylariales sp. AK1849]